MTINNRILIDAREYPSSTGRYVRQLLQYLPVVDTDQTRRYTVLVKSADIAAAQDQLKHDGRFTIVASDHKEFTLAEQTGLLKQLYKLKPDLVHFTMTQQPALYRKKHVTTIHDLITLHFTNPDKNIITYKLKQQVYKWLVHHVARTSKQIITPTEFVKNDVQKFASIPADKITTTLEAADKINDPAQPLATLKNKQFIMYIGRPTPHKNLDRLVEAYKTLKAQHPNLYLVLAGKIDNNYQAIQKRTKSEHNIIFTDKISDAQLRWLYENCAAYVFPSLSEGFGLPGLEAMVHGAPVVSSNASCLPEVYGNAAHYFDPTDTQAMADAINEVLTNKDLRQSLVTAGHAQAAKFSWERMAKQTLQVYEQALKQ